MTESKEIRNVEELINFLGEAKSFIIGVTILNPETKELNHYLFNKNFPQDDMYKSLNAHKKLIKTLKPYQPETPAVTEAEVVDETNS